MPQTRFVLLKSIEMRLRTILLINKIDKKDQRAVEVVDLVYELFLDLKATDKQLDFPILYGVARDGVVVKNVNDEGKSLQPLFDTIIDHIEAYPDLDDKPLQMQVSSLGYDDYIGRLGIGRIFEGTIRVNQQVMIYKRSGNIEKKTINQIYIYDG